jgi:WD40 repeat protein
MIDGTTASGGTYLKASISGLTIADGSAGPPNYLDGAGVGGGILNSGAPTVSNCTITNNTAGKTFLAAYDIGRARLWDVSTWTPIGPPFPHHGAVSAVAFSPDGKTLLTGCEDRMARLGDVATRSLLSPPLPHPGWVFGVAFSPDGEIVVTGCREGGRVRLGDAYTGPPLPNQEAVTAVAFSPDGKAVVTGHSDPRARLFRLAPGLPDDLERVATWVEVLTGLTLDAQRGSIRVLDKQTGLARWERLRRLGSPPEGWRGY